MVSLCTLLWWSKLVCLSIVVSHSYSYFWFLYHISAKHEASNCTSATWSCLIMAENNPSILLSSIMLHLTVLFFFNPSLIGVMKFKHPSNYISNNWVVCWLNLCSWPSNFNSVLVNSRSSSWFWNFKKNIAAVVFFS